MLDDLRGFYFLYLWFTSSQDNLTVWFGFVCKDPQIFLVAETVYEFVDKRYRHVLDQNSFCVPFMITYPHNT